MKESILELSGINKSFFGVPALKDVSFTLKRRQILGLIGENGAGKSTLMNIIGGVIAADSGRLMLEAYQYHPKNPGDATKAGIAFIHQELNLFTNLSIAENIFIDNFPKLGGMPLIKKRTIKARTKELLESINLAASPDMLVEKLSPGERQLVEIAKALSVDAQIIIFDEPTTSLTARETERLFKLICRLQADGRSIIYISHILQDVLNIADEIVVLRDGQVTDSGIKADFTIDRMISQMVGRDIKQLYPSRTSVPSTEKTLEVSGINQSGIVCNINFSLYKGEVLGVFGLMGSGRTEMARILFGLDPHEKGQILVHGNPLQKKTPISRIRNQMAFVTENRREEGLLMDVSIAENIGLVSLANFASRFFKLVKRSRMYESAKEIIDLLQIKCNTFEKSPVKSLSGGNQQKVVIGKWLMSKPSVLFVDEPTRGIDVGAKYEVYNIINHLAAEGAGVLIISSEIEELTGICDRILVMSKGEIVGSFQRAEFNREQILRAAFRQNEIN